MIFLIKELNSPFIIPKNNKYLKPITISDLLTHSAGIDER